MAKPPKKTFMSFDGPQGQEDMPYLLTPGPLTTSAQTKQAMLADWGSRDIEFRHLIGTIRSGLLKIAHADSQFECVLMQGAGTFAIEAALSSFCPKGRKKKTLVVVNGAYGHRAAKILSVLKRPHITLEFDEETPIDVGMVEKALKDDEDISTVFFVHCETTTGIINPITELTRICKANDTTVFVDAMSSFGALDINMAELDVDILVSSANKCIEGVPGFGYVLCKQELLEASKGKSHSVALDLYDQWAAMEKTAQFRFTPPTHALVAFHEALQEHEAEGGVEGRGEKYRRNADTLLKGMARLGFKTLLGRETRGPIIQTFLSPENKNFQFNTFYEGLRTRGFAIYPGKLTKRDSFRIGTIGKLNEAVFKRFLFAVQEVMSDMDVHISPD